MEYLTLRKGMCEAHTLDLTAGGIALAREFARLEPVQTKIISSSAPSKSALFTSPFQPGLRAFNQEFIMDFQ